MDWLHIVYRSLGAILMMFLIARILGKKQIAQLTYFEYIVGITLGDLAGFISVDFTGNFLHGIAALATWFVIPLAVELVSTRSKKIRDALEGSGTVLIKEGKILEDNMKRERFSAEELMLRLRTKNVFNVADVEFAVMETNGDLSVLLKKENQPLTMKHLGLKTPSEVAPQAVIIEGKVIEESLATLGFNMGWLHTELDKMGIPVNNIYLAQVDAYGELYVDLYDDQLQLPAPQNRALLHATLKKCEADLELFALGTKDQSAKAMYGQCAADLEQVIHQMKPLLKS